MPRGKVALVTGGGRGLGKAIVEALEREGVTAVAGLRRQPESHVEVFLDVRDERSVQEAFRTVVARYERLDLLVNNAGVGLFKPLTELTLQDFKDSVEVNLTGTFLCAREAFKVMAAQGGGRIINIGSVADFLPLPMAAAYGASKSGVRGLTGVINEEGKAVGVRATLLSPGATYTDIWKGRPGFSAEDMLRPEDVAQAVVEIASKPLHVRVDEVRMLPPRGVL